MLLWDATVTSFSVKSIN